MNTMTFLAKHFVLFFLLATCNAQQQQKRQVWAWASYNIHSEETIQQLYNSTWNPVVDGIQAACGCRFTDTGISFNDTIWAACAPLFRAAKETNTKFQLWIAGNIPEQADVTVFIRDALDLYHHLGVDGFSIDDEQDCAPRATTDKFETWITWQNTFAAALLQDYGIPVTSAVQALFAINDNTPDNDPCAKAPSAYTLDTRVVELLQKATLQKWLVMDTYYFTTGRFLGALDWHTTYIPKKTLAMGMMNRDDLTDDDLVARFHAIDKSGVVDWINIFIMPISDAFLPYLERWKTHCAGCGKQTILGCYDMSIECNQARISESEL